MKQRKVGLLVEKTYIAALQTFHSLRFISAKYAPNLVTFYIATQIKIKYYSY